MWLDELDDIDDTDDTCNTVLLLSPLPRRLSRALNLLVIYRG